MKVKPLHDCPVFGCVNSRNPEHMMCFRHWRRVPGILQLAVWDAYRAWQSHTDRSDDGESYRNYLSVRRRAISAVEEKEDGEVVNAPAHALENRKREKKNFRAIEPPALILAAGSGALFVGSLKPAKPEPERARFRMCPIARCKKCGDRRHVLCRVHFELLPKALRSRIAAFAESRTRLLGARLKIDGAADRAAYMALGNQFRDAIRAAVAHLNGEPFGKQI